MHRRLYFEAIRSLPINFGLQDEHWGKELNEDCLWIHLQEYETMYAYVYDQIAFNSKYNAGLINKIKEDILDFENCIEKNMQIDYSESHFIHFIQSARQAVSWFPCNWFNPKTFLQQAIFSMYNNRDAENLFNLVCHGGHFPIFIEAWKALDDVQKMKIDKRDFIFLWGGIFNESKNLSRVQTSKDVDDLLAQLWQIDLEGLIKEHESKLNDRDQQLTEFINRCNSLFGAEKKQLVKSQIDLLDTIIWQEETRRLMQERLYRYLEMNKSIIQEYFRVFEKINWLNYGHTLKEQL